MKERVCSRFSLPLMLALALVPAAAAGGDVELDIDASNPGATVGMELHGQFIEHLGRCIRGGIWAEMLRDRKLLLEPGKSWEVVKPGNASAEVFHDTAGAYAGDHCTAVWVRDAAGDCGIRQGGIGLLEGKIYVGRAVIASIGEKAPVKVSLGWGDGEKDRQSVLLEDLGPGYRSCPFRFRAGATTDAAVLSLTVSSPAYLWVACLSLMPEENLRGMRPDTLALIRGPSASGSAPGAAFTLRPPVTRWPGGNFVSGYNWKDAIGERDRRPSRWERAWSDVEENDFGADEFMDFSKEVGTEAYVAVNTGLGSVQDAADEVEYFNGSPGSRWGAVRARNGHAEPYRVKWWGVGNEMYGGWQLGNVPVERYAARHNAFVRAMKEKDPTIKVIAVGAPGRWNDVMLPACAGSTDLLSGHHYTERKFGLPFSPPDDRKYAEGFVAYSGSVAEGVRGLVTDFRKRLGKGSAEVDRVRLAIDEWGIVRDWNPAPDGPGIGSFEHYYCLGDAIAVARGLHEILRSADVVAMANWAQTVNVIGTIKTSRTAAVLDAAGQVLALYREHFTGPLVPVVWGGASTVDAVACLRQTGSGKPESLSLGLINYSPTEPESVTLRIDGLSGGPSKAPRLLSAWRIAAPGLGSFNEPGKPPSVATKRLAEGEAGPLGKPMVLPPHSITVIVVGPGG